MKQESGNKAKGWLLRLGGDAVVLCLAVLGFCYWINITPQVKIPKPVMPKPNGYNYFLRAGAAFVKDRKGVDRITNPHSTSEKNKQYPIAAKEEWLKKNAKALHLLREGLKYPALLSVGEDEAIYPRYHQFTDMALALRVESHVKVARHNWQGASNSILDILEFGYDIPRGGSLYSTAKWVGLAMQVSSLQEMLHLLPHLDAISSQKAAARMEHLYDGRFLFSQVMQEEKREVQRDLLKEMNKSSWRWQLYMNHIFGDDSAEEESDPTSSIFVVKKQTLLNECTELMDKYVANAHLPYSEMGPIPDSQYYLANYFIHYYCSEYPDGQILYWDQARVETYNMLIITMLSLHAFRLEKGYYPASLKELVPQYLKKVPIDPFIGKAPLHYQIKHQRYKLWSVGPDGIDNHGTPITNDPDELHRYSRYQVVYFDSKGDIVAGVNVP